MKTFPLFTLLALLAAPATLAQPGEHDTRAERAERMLDRRLDLLDEQLRLSDRQESRLRRIYVQHQTRLRVRAEAARADIERREEMRDVPEAGDAEAMRRRRDEVHARMRTEWEALDREVRAVLNRDQRPRYDEMRREERRRFEERMRERRPGHGDGPHGERTRVYIIRRPSGS